MSATFDLIDLNRDGVITRQEFAAMMMQQQRFGQPVHAMLPSATYAAAGTPYAAPPPQSFLPSAVAPQAVYAAPQFVHQLPQMRQGPPQALTYAAPPAPPQQQVQHFIDPQIYVAPPVYVGTITAQQQQQGSVFYDAQPPQAQGSVFYDAQPPQPQAPVYSYAGGAPTVTYVAEMSAPQEELYTMPALVNGAMQQIHHAAPPLMAVPTTHASFADSYAMPTTAYAAQAPQIQYAAPGSVVYYAPT